MPFDPPSDLRSYFPVTTSARCATGEVVERPFNSDLSAKPYALYNTFVAIQRNGSGSHLRTV